MTTIAWNLINLSHYHAARWKAFVSRADEPAIVLELANKDSGFTALEANGGENFRRRILFPNRSWQDIAGWGRAFAIWRALDEISPDVVCLNGWSMGGAQASLAWVVSRGRRAVLMSESNHFDFTRSNWREAVKSRLIGMVSAALVGGTLSRDYLIHLGMSADRVFLGYDAVDNRHFSAAAARESTALGGLSTPFFIAAGRFEEKKNHARLLDAYAKYKSRAGGAVWSLVLLGDGRLKPEILTQIDRLRLGGAVILPGFKRYEELPSWYGAASCFIHPSTTEQWGLVVNEAMAAGLPVLVSNRCGCAVDLVREGVNGFTFDPYDVERMADLMWQMAHGNVDREATGRASQEIIANWGPERFADGLTKAVNAARAAPSPRPKLLDKALLWTLIHR